jgi:hypothetical protein
MQSKSAESSYRINASCEPAANNNQQQAARSNQQQQPATKHIQQLGAINLRKTHQTYIRIIRYFNSIVFFAHYSRQGELRNFFQNLRLQMEF